MKIAPSILSANFAILKEEIISLDKSGADMFHIDIMDGHFVNNLTFGTKLVEDIRPYTNKPFDVHLMVSNPQNYFEGLKKANVQSISFHYEATNHHDALLNNIKSMDIKAGIALNPSTPIGVLENIHHLLDFILVMGVNPGWGGQKFIENTYNKVSSIAASYPSVDISIDGGVDVSNAKKLIQSGANTLVAGTSIFANFAYKENIIKLKE